MELSDTKTLGTLAHFSLLLSAIPFGGVVTFFKGDLLFMINRAI
jgi:hypothetical protein